MKRLIAMGYAKVFKAKEILAKSSKHWSYYRFLLLGDTIRRLVDSVSPKFYYTGGVKG